MIKIDKCYRSGQMENTSNIEIQHSNYEYEAQPPICEKQ